MTFTASVYSIEWNFLFTASHSVPIGGGYYKRSRILLFLVSNERYGPYELCAHIFFRSATCSPCNACKTCKKCQKWLFFKVFDVLGHFKGVRKPIFRYKLKHMDNMDCVHKFFPGLHHAVHTMHAKHAKNAKNGYFSQFFIFLGSLKLCANQFLGLK